MLKLLPEECWSRRVTSWLRIGVVLTNVMLEDQRRMNLKRESSAQKDKEECRSTVLGLEDDV